LRFAPIVLATVMVLPTIAFLSPASSAVGATIVDAGNSQVVEADVVFTLEGHLDGFGAGVSVAWSAPTGCTLGAPTLLITTATCGAPGLTPFTLTATDGAASASDDVVISIVRVVQSSILHATGSDAAAAQGVPVHSHIFRVAAGTTHLAATLAITSDTPVAADYDFRITPSGGASRNAATSAPVERIDVEAPTQGFWTANAISSVVVAGHYVIDIIATTMQGIGALPQMDGNGVRAAVGDVVTLRVTPNGGTAPYDVRWETNAASRAFDDGSGESFTFTFTQPGVVLVRLRDANGLEVTKTLPVGEHTLRPVTVVAVVDNAFSPYHFDFIGSQHPWNKDMDATNDFDASADPAGYIPGHPGATPLTLTLPTAASEVVSDRASGVDAAAWASMQASSLATGIHLYWLPGTKIVGAVHFGGGFVGTNDDHGTRSAASTAGNVHGTCPECLFVLVQDGAANAGLIWAASQPWIDVVTNSYGHGGPVQGASLGLTRDNMYWDGPVAATRAASEAGQTIVFSAGNGLVNAFDVPMFTYWSSEKGPDWFVTVGAVDPDEHQTYSGAGKPVDVSSIGNAYPSSGGTTANGVGTHSGTSNAAPTTAGYFGEVLQRAREALGDVTPGHAGGVVASGTPIACGSAVINCALGDGVLTRRELQDLVLLNVLPSGQVVMADTVWPSTDYNYYYQGHGVLSGRYGGDAKYLAETAQMMGNARGEAASPTRPAGESNWFIVDSKCRQHIWGAWTGGDYQGVEPTLDAMADPIASAFDAWCSNVPEHPFPSNDPTA